MRTSFMTIAAAAFAVAASAASGAITIGAFDAGTYNPGFGQPPNVGEDFETLGANGGEREVGFDGSPFDTGTVGTFETLGGTGTGGTTSPAWNTGTGLALRDGNVFGRANTTPDNGAWFLDSNDTFGLEWIVSLATGQAFDRILFTLSDAADTGAFVTVTDGDDTVSLQNQGNGSVKLIDITFDTPVTEAKITIENFRNSSEAENKTNDGFGIDGIQVSAVPVPASILSLGLGLAAIGAGFSRRRRTA